MADREASKARKRTPKPPAVHHTATAGRHEAPGTSAPAAAGHESAETRALRLEAELTRLRADLSAARARIARLEQARDQALDRIAWAIDSLHNLNED